MKVKVITVLLIFLLVILHTNYSNAFSTTIDHIIGTGENFVTGASMQISTTEVTGFSQGINKILLSLATVIMVGVGVYLGVQFMAGSAEGKAKVMDSLIPYVIGCIVIYGSFMIWEAAIKIVGNLEKVS